MITSLDGNVQLQDTLVPLGTNKIKINITKNVTKNVINSENTEKIGSSETNSLQNSSSSLSTTVAAMPTEPQPIEEIEFDYKDSMKGVEFKKLPLVRNGSETSGLCSIM